MAHAAGQIYLHLNGFRSEADRSGALAAWASAAPRGTGVALIAGGNRGGACDAFLLVPMEEVIIAGASWHAACILARCPSIYAPPELKFSTQNHTKHPGWYVDLGSRHTLASTSNAAPYTSSSAVPAQAKTSGSRPGIPSRPVPSATSRPVPGDGIQMFSPNELH